MRMFSASRTRHGGTIAIVAVAAVAAWIGTRPAPPTHEEQLRAQLRKERLALEALLRNQRGSEVRFFEHGDVTPRASSDPRNGRIRGCVAHAGKPIAGLEVQVAVWPLGMSFTYDYGRTDASGCYDVIVRAKGLSRKQIAELVVHDDLVGRVLVYVEPGKTTEHADFEVGPGFAVAGIVRDRRGEPVAGVWVTDDEMRFVEETHADGRFRLRLDSTGRHRLYVYSSLDRTRYDQAQPVLFDVDRLEGGTADVVITVEDRVTQGRVAAQLAGTKPFTIKPICLRPGATAPEHGWCSALSRGKDGALEESANVSGFELELAPEHVQIRCDEMWGFAANTRTVAIPATPSTIELPVVPIARNAVDLGIELRADARSVRVIAVAAEAKSAGLRPGDVIVAVDGISVVGFTAESIYELGFHLPPGQSVSWTIERGGVRSTLHARAPGQPREALYIQ